jgi:uncharacterized protein
MIDIVSAPDDASLRECCRKYGISRLALFGSALRDDFGPDSDVDMLVEFKPGATPGLEFFAIQEELSKLVGRTVDLQTAESLSPYFRDEVLAVARDVYVAP